MHTLLKGRRLMVVAAVAVLAVALASCGSSNSSTSSSGPTKGSGIRAGTGTRTEKSAAAGKTAAKDVGGPVKLPSGKTIGIINFLNGIESSDRLASTTKLAIKELGWKAIQCDGKGTPTQFVACGNQLLDRGVNGIIEVAIEPGQIQSVLNKAKSKNVPVIQVGGGAIPNGDLSGNYGPDEAQSGKLLSDAIFQRLGSAPNKTVAIQDFPAKWGSTRTDQFRQAVKGQSAIKIVADYETDAANLVPFTRKAVSDQLTKNPNLGAYWFTFDTTGQVGGQVIASKYKGKTFPNRPLVATFHADLGTLDLMRQGDIDVTSDVNYDAAAWMGVDQTAEFFARGTEPSKENQPNWPAVGDLFSYKIVDKTNLPPKGQYVAPKWDVPTYFTSKWKSEFGNSVNGSS
jgi:ABC-type sugar transport system substrate-binding protein